MDFHIDPDRGREVGSILYEKFTAPGVGIFGSTAMPEDPLPEGVSRGSREHLLFITLTAAVDYQRDAHQLWQASRDAYRDPATRYLFSPEQLKEKPQTTIIGDLRKRGVSRRPRRDAWIWTTVAFSFLKKWNGDPRAFLDAHGYNAPVILEHLIEDTHARGGAPVPDFPYLRGPKIAPLWLRMLRDNVGIALRQMSLIPIPADVHIARATFSLGVIRGKARLPFPKVFSPVQSAWKQAAEGTERIALDFDEPLWHLSKFGCRRRTAAMCPRARECPVAIYCVPGRVHVSSELVDIDTQP